MKNIVAALAALFFPSPYQVATEAGPVGDQLPVEQMADSTSHPYWTLPAWRVDQFRLLASCESHGQLDAVNRTGTFRGLLQFSRVTWESVGGSGDPAEATFEEQVWRGHVLQERSGWGQWPHCSVAVGLR